MDKYNLLENIDVVAAEYASGSIDIKDLYEKVSYKCMEHIKFTGFKEVFLTV